jgi:hypothetical protein
MEVKHKNIQLGVGICKKVSDIGVCLTISYKGISPYCLKTLLCNNPPQEPKLMQGSEEAALAFSVFECIRDKMIGSPLESVRSKVSNIKCKSLNNKLVIYWNCQGTGSALRKTLSLAISCLTPHKLYSKYKENMKFLGGSAPKEHFNYCVKNMIDSIKNNIHIVAVGRINIDAQKLDILVKSVYNKYPKLESPSDKEIKMPPKRECDIKTFPYVKCSSGLACIAVADFINSNSGGMGVEVHTGIVEVYNDNWETKKNQINSSKRIEDYVRQKYDKLEDHLGLMLGYYAITKCYADSDTLSKLILKNITSQELKKLIKEAL